VRPRRADLLRFCRRIAHADVVVCVTASLGTILRRMDRRHDHLPLRGGTAESRRLFLERAQAVFEDLSRLDTERRPWVLLPNDGSCLTATEGEVCRATNAIAASFKEQSSCACAD
jgi:hypothetical protein